MGGLGRSWSVPVYILNGNFPDVFQGEEDPVPFDSEPHPEFGPPVMGANPVFPNWEGEHQGADVAYGAHGGNPHPNPVQQAVHPQHGDVAPAANIAGGLAWEPANINVNPDAVQQQQLAKGNVIAVAQGQPLHHPLNPQDVINLELSGSSRRFMRGEGSDIPIDVTVNSDDDNSSSSDATSLLSEHMVANRGCSGHLRPIPGFTLRGIFAPGASSSSQGQQQMQAPDFFKPIVIDTSTLFANQEKVHIPNGMEIVPWKPTGAALALQFVCGSVEYQGTEDHDQQGSLQSSASTLLDAQASWPSPITRFYKRRPKPKNGNMLGHKEDKHKEDKDTEQLHEQAMKQSPTGSSPGNFEFEATQAQPSPPTSVGQQAKRGRSRKIVSLPAPSNSSTPLVESSVRRSTRLNNAKEGFHFRTVRLDGEPSKKRKKPAVVLIDEATGQAGPIPLEILQSWGIYCGIAPAELSEDALMQAPASSSTVINE